MWMLSLYIASCVPAQLRRNGSKKPFEINTRANLPMGVNRLSFQRRFK
jgi:hypothetical protein